MLLFVDFNKGEFYDENRWKHITNSQTRKRLQRFMQFLNEYQAKELALQGNLVKVSSYTRADGTHVDGYYRRLSHS